MGSTTHQQLTRTIQFRLINPHSKRIVGYERLSFGVRRYPLWQYSVDGKTWDTGVFEGDGWLRDQASGIQDRFGRDIYENDIVARANHKNLVIFKQGMFGMNYLKPRWAYPDGSRKVFPLYANLEVIGNIHAHPELLPKDVA